MGFGRRIYPDKGRLQFDGGLNTKYERSLIADNESPDCLNVVFSNGSVATRQGVAKLNTAAVGSFVGDGLYTRHDNDTSETMCAWWNGTLYTLATTTFSTVPSAQSIFTAGQRVTASEYENYIFFGNGGSIPYKYNGAEFTRHGVYPPTATSTVASQATGVLTGDFVYKVTNVNSNLVESDVGPATATFTAASATLRVTLPTFAVSYGVNSRRLYRLDSGTYKRVATISDNTTTTYDDNVATAALGTAAPTDNGVPPNYSVSIYHQDRLIVNDPNNPNYVWYSNLGTPYTFASTNFIKVGDNTSDLVRGFGVYENSLYVYCDNSIWLIYMPDTTASGWIKMPVKTHHGSKSPFCVLNYNNKQLFPAQQNAKFAGFAAVSGKSVAPSATLLTAQSIQSDLQSDRVEPDMFSVIESKIQNISGIVFKNKAWISMTYGSGSTTNNRVYIFDFSIDRLNKQQEASWVPFTGLNVAQFTIYAGNLYFQSSTATGFVYKAEAGVYADDGSAINSYFWTKEFGGDLGEFNFEKDFRYAKILNDNSGDFFMDFGYRVNSDKGSGNTKQVDLDPGGSLWGTMMWGRDMWGGGTDQSENRVYLDGVRGERIQFKFSNQNKANQNFKVHGLSFIYNVKGFR